jgi:predicted nucleic acid-binding protein
LSRIILLDTGPLGLITHPQKNPEIKAWLQKLVLKEVLVRVPEIADYELRREPLRARKTRGIQRLDALKASIGYLPITTDVMLRAAELWAQARQQGQPTADNRALDGNIILVAQAAELMD